MAHEEIISETFKNYATSSNNLKKKNIYDGIWNFWQLQNMYNTAGCPYMIDT